MIGNTWEWTTDWYTPRHPGDVRQGLLHSPEPTRGSHGAELSIRTQPAIRIPRKVLKGGSHLCAPNYCRRYRPAARYPEPDRHLDQPRRVPLHSSQRQCRRGRVMQGLPLEELLKSFASRVALGIEFVAVLVILTGVILAISRLFTRAGITFAPPGKSGVFVGLGRWLVLGLEFALAADIVRTAISPTWTDIGQLAAIAAIRTFLNYFLTRDLEQFGSEGSVETGHG